MTLQRHSPSTEVVFVLKHPTRKQKERLYSDFRSNRSFSKSDAYISSSQPFSTCGTVDTFDMSQGKRFNAQDLNL
jgi:hypothetical protein